jgi:hypothetical protein
MLEQQEKSEAIIMNKVLKWILYVLLGLILLAVIGGFLAMIFGGFGYGMMRPGIRMMEPGIRIMGPYSYHNPIGWFFGGLLCLGLILLVIVGIVALVSYLVNRDRPTQVTADAQATTVPVVEAAPERACANCGRPAQPDWKTCPYCGNPLE